VAGWKKIIHSGSDAHLNDLYLSGDIIHAGDTDTKIQFNTDIINFDTAGTERIRITAGGNVGIGTATPGEKLSIAGNVVLGEGAQRSVRYDSTVGSFRITPNNGGWATGYFFNNQSEGLLGGFGALGGTNDSFSYFWIGDNYNDTTMVIQPNAGNVGIGTTTPNEKLSVDGNVKAISFTGSLSGTASHALVADSVTDATLLAQSNLWYNGTTYLSSSKEVHIHAPNPVLVLKDTTDDDDHQIQFQDTGGNVDYKITTTGDIFNIHTVSNTPIAFHTNNVERMRILNGGNVGIGTVTPTEKLHINGNLRLGNIKIEDTVGGRIGFNRNTATGTIYNSSISAYQVQNEAGKFEIQSYTGAGAYLGSVFIVSGSVGIGAATPSRKLHVNAGTTNEAVRIESTDTEVALELKDST